MHCTGVAVAENTRRALASEAAFASRLACTALVMGVSNASCVGAVPLVASCKAWGVWGDHWPLPSHGDHTALPWWQLPQPGSCQPLTRAPLPRPMPAQAPLSADLGAHASKWRNRRLLQAKYAHPHMREDKFAVFLNTHALATAPSEPSRTGPSASVVAAATLSPGAGPARTASVGPDRVGAAGSSDEDEAQVGFGSGLWAPAPASRPIPLPEGGGCLAVTSAPPTPPFAPAASEQGEESDGFSSSSSCRSGTRSMAKVPRQLFGRPAVVGTCRRWQRALWSGRGGRRRRRTAQAADGGWSSDESQATATSSHSKRSRRSEAQARRAAQRRAREARRAEAAKVPAPAPASPLLRSSTSLPGHGSVSTPLLARHPSCDSAPRSVRSLRKLRSRRKGKATKPAPGPTPPMSPQVMATKARLDDACVPDLRAVPLTRKRSASEGGQATSTHPVSQPAKADTSDGSAAEWGGEVADSGAGSEADRPASSSASEEGAASTRRQDVALPPDPWVMSSWAREEPMPTGLCRGAGVGGRSTPACAVSLRHVLAFPDGSACVVTPFPHGPGACPLHEGSLDTPPLSPASLSPPTDASFSRQEWRARTLLWLPRVGGEATAGLADTAVVTGVGGMHDVLFGGYGRAVGVWGVPPSPTTQPPQATAPVLASPHVHSDTVTAVAALPSPSHCTVRVQAEHLARPGVPAQESTPAKSLLAVPSTLALSGDLAGEVHLWGLPNTAPLAVCHLSDGRVVSPLHPLHLAPPHAASHSTVARGFLDDGDVAPWAGDAEEPQGPARTLPEAVSALCASEHILLAGGSRGTVALWKRRRRREDGADLPPILLQHTPGAHQVVRLAQAHSGPRVDVAVTAGGQGELCLWTAGQSGVACRALRGHSGPVTSLLLSQHVLVSAGQEGKVRVWGVSRHPGRALRCLSVSGGGQATGGGGAEGASSSARRLRHRAKRNTGGHVGMPEPGVGGYPTALAWHAGALLVGTSTGYLHAVALDAFNPLHTPLATPALPPAPAPAPAPAPTGSPPSRPQRRHPRQSRRAAGGWTGRFAAPDTPTSQSASPARPGRGGRGGGSTGAQRGRGRARGRGRSKRSGRR